MFCDLHAHSRFSDGSDTPEDLVELAKKQGLKAVALTDHNTVAGLPDFVNAARGRGVEPVPGCEFSTDYQGTELHILGLFLEPKHYATVTALLEEAQREKERSSRDLVASLVATGYALDYDAICQKTSGQINRAHVAAALMEGGYVSSVKEAFQTLLGKQHGHYRAPKRIDAYDCIRFIKSIGAVAVLAHPFLDLDSLQLRAFLPQAVEAGLDAMEVAYSKYSPQTTDEAARIAGEFGLLPSGGSDYHGYNKPDIQLGTGRGDLRIPYSWLEAMRKRI